MTWFKVDDSFHSHPKVLAADPAALGLWVIAGSWCGANPSDGFVPDYVLSRLIPGASRLAVKLVAVGLWQKEAAGYRFRDWADYNPTAMEAKAAKASNARRQALFRNPEIREAVRTRDQDFCRYCGVQVRWNDRRGPHGGTYDHIDPTGANSLDNLAVCCRSCNSRKGSRTPEQAGMMLTQIQNGSSYVPSSQLGSHNPPSRPVPKGTSVRGESPEPAAREQRPPERCSKHIDDLDAPPCGACANARRLAAGWDSDAPKRLVDERLTIRACPFCDADGWRYTPGTHIPATPWVRCDHTRTEVHA